MSKYEKKDGDIFLSKNKFKQSGDKKPDYIGNYRKNGQDYKVALWFRKDGLYLSGKLSDDLDIRE